MVEKLTSIAKNAGQSLIGNIEKAVIEITDERSNVQLPAKPSVPAPSMPKASKTVDAGNRDITVLPHVSMDGISIGGASIGGTSIGSALGTAAASGKTITATLSNAVSTELDKTVNEIKKSAPSSTSKRFEVQFNPNTLNFSGYGGGMTTKTDYSSGNAISFEAADVRISMNVQLIFDKVDTQDAFMVNQLNTTAMITNTAKAVMKTTGKWTYSVQPEVEGFIAALRSPKTRSITFHWGKLNYSGILNRVSAQYTMFNVHGAPIRAIVELSLVCADKDVSPESMGMWQKYYNEAFGNGNLSLVDAGQYTSNILNFSL